MGGNSSRPNRSRGLVLYDEEKASKARTHTKTDFVDPRSLVDKLVPGDLVQKKGQWVHQWFYSHFAVYYGNGYIIHVTKSNGEIEIVRELMTTAFEGSLVRKNNLLDNTRNFHARSPRTIARIAREMIGTPWDYNFFTSNCEHFAALCRYGRKVSLQSSGFADILAGHITWSEFLDNFVQSVKEKFGTLVSWINRTFRGIFDKLFGLG